MTRFTSLLKLDATLVGIAAVERDTGLSKDILRIWERRYGFPLPLRDGGGDRVYSVEQVQRLRLLKRLLDGGHRPGRIVGASLETLEAMLPGTPQSAPGKSRRGKQIRLDAAAASATDAAQIEDMTTCLQLLRGHQVDELYRHMTLALMRQGLGGFVRSLVAPLTRLVGESWLRGELEVFEEHIYTETVQRVLRPAINGFTQQDGGGRPRVLLTTLPGEPHGLGLLMVEALLVIEACQCLSLGVQTPGDEIPRAAAAHGSDIVALSFSELMSAGMVRRGLSDLRAALPASTELWAGGTAMLLKHPLKLGGTKVITDLAELAAAVGHWRAAQSRA